MSLKEDACLCEPCDCDVPAVSAGDACVCANPPCDCGFPKDECVCKPCECDLPAELCVCDPCVCETPPGSPKDPPASPQGAFCDPINTGRGFTLNEFIRAKEYFLTTSTNSGLNLYDHMSEVLRKMLDARAPPNSVDFLEELSLNIKRYRFGMPIDLIRDTYYLSPPLVDDAMSVMETWRQHAQWSKYQLEEGEEGSGYGGFPNLMRLLYYLEHVNVGLPREEMFRIALALRQVNLTHPIKRSRFWGKVFGIEKNYYVIEAELSGPNEEDLWKLEGEEELAAATNGNAPNNNFFSGAETFDRARSAVTDPNILIPYQETSGLPPGPINCVMPPSTAEVPGEFGGEGYGDAPIDAAAAAEAVLWASYQKELMEGFPPVPKLPEEVIIPTELEGQGVNRRAFYVTNQLSDNWILLPPVTPKQIQVSRNIRRFLTGKLDTKLDVYPEFPGREAHYLKALLSRITAGSQVSPKGYYRRTPQQDEEEEEEDVEEEDDEYNNAADILFAVTKFNPPPMVELLSQPPSYWVHHTSHILRQGRINWWNPAIGAMNYEDEELGEEEEPEVPEREFGPSLFSSLAADKTLEGWSPWSPRASSTVFTEFQIASVRSNVWPGATAFCTYKGKVENVYIGDGMKFRGTCFAPHVPQAPQVEYKDGPELTEIDDPTYEQEQAWVLKLELDGLNDVEEKFVDNEVSDLEEEATTEEDEED